MILVGLTSRERQWPMWMIVPCWLPALVVLSDRFAPRPELLSLLAMAVYLTVLRRADRSPALAWVLPLVQVFWVNAHALFILGPIILGAYLIDRLRGRSGDRGQRLAAGRRGAGGGFTFAVRPWPSAWPAWPTPTACVGPCFHSSSCPKLHRVQIFISHILSSSWI